MLLLGLVVVALTTCGHAMKARGPPGSQAATNLPVFKPHVRNGAPPTQGYKPIYQPPSTYQNHGPPIYEPSTTIPQHHGGLGGNRFLNNHMRYVMLDNILDLPDPVFNPFNPLQDPYQAILAPFSTGLSQSSTYNPNALGHNPGINSVQGPLGAPPTGNQGLQLGPLIRQHAYASMYDLPGSMLLEAMF